MSSMCVYLWLSREFLPTNAVNNLLKRLGTALRNPVAMSASEGWWEMGRLLNSIRQTPHWPVSHYRLIVQVMLSI